MNTPITKSTIHKFIDDIDDKNQLELVCTLFDNLQYNEKNTNGDIIDILTLKQKKRLEESILQAKKGETFTDTEVKKEIKKWLTK